MNDYDYCSKCYKVCDYLDLKSYNLKWYCNKCYIEETSEDPIAAGTSLYELCDYDYCSKCGELFDYLDLKPYNLKWYCECCYKEVAVVDAIAMSKTK